MDSPRIDENILCTGGVSTGRRSVISPQAVGAEQPRVLLAASGSVAAIKLPELARLLAEFADVRLLMTAAARKFVSEADFPPEVLPIYGDEDDWRSWQCVGDPVLHIELRRWADVLVVAPLSANTLAKAAGGLCDNLLTCVVRAWDFSKPMLVAPAMNTFMWNSPFTAKHVAVLQQIGAIILDPVKKTLACGDSGMGAMASPTDIAQAVKHSLLTSKNDPVVIPALK